MSRILLPRQCKLAFRLAGLFALSMWMAGAATPAQAGYAHITWATASGPISGTTSFAFSGTLNRFAGGAPLGQRANLARWPF